MHNKRMHNSRENAQDATGKDSAHNSSLFFNYSQYGSKQSGYGGTIRVIGTSQKQ